LSREADLFDAACDRPPADRAAFLEQACAGDPALRARVEGLLAGYAEAERVLPATLIPRGSPAPEEKPGDWIGRYKLLGRIGEGGCGSVWMAAQESPVRRRVALKVIKLGMDTKAVVARFEAERQALALMDHPHIAKVHDAGATETGRPFFVMELVRGVPITRYCENHGLPTAARLKLFIDVCRAMQHAHEKGIIHRDLKPSNLLVAQHGDVAVPKVIDFGVAKATQGRLTEATLFTAFEQFIGTPAYMSPEQAEFSGLEVDARSDLYSLGVLLYELLTGRPPFDPKTLQQSGIDEMRRIIREEEPPRPSTRLSKHNVAEASRRSALEKTAAGYRRHEDISSDLDWIVMKALEKDRTRRYASAEAFAQDVQRYLEHKPVVARPPSAIYVGGKFLRRHRLAVAAAALVAGTATVSTVVSTGFWSGQRTASPGGTATPPPARPISEKSLAILPFQNQSPDSANAFFADGLHEDVLSHLFNIRELIVRSRTSVESYRGTAKGMKEIGAELGVAYVLEGSVRREGSQVQLNVRLVDARTDAPRWAKVFHGELRDIFALQAELAAAIAAELRTVLSPEEKQLLAQKLTDSPAAYDLYLEGRAVLRARFERRGDPTRYARAEALFKSAIDQDPAFVSAWAELALVHGQVYLGNWNHTPERLEKARKATEMVVRLAPNSVKAGTAQAQFFYSTRDYAKALQHYEALARLQPNYPQSSSWQNNIAGCLRRLGRWPEAIAAKRRAIALAIDPEPEKRPDALISMLEAGRRYREADEEELRWLRTHPEEWERNFDRARRAVLAGRPISEAEELLRAVTEAQAGSAAGIQLQKRWAFFTGNLDEAIRLDRANPDPTEHPNEKIFAAFVYLARGDSLAATARLPKSAELLAELEQQPENDSLVMNLAWIAALSGNREEALRRAEEAARLRPESVDAWFSAHQGARRAVVRAWAGDKDRAIAELTRLLRVPGSELNIHEMKRAPQFAPLRGDPRFEALLNDPKNNAPLF
jgi:serine/threonine protein kinase/Tfp pilus assembly protein PilF